MTDRDVQCQRRDARFDESPLGGGMCPLLLDVALFPVRYAIDEAPGQAGEPAPHPLASPWQGPDYPELQTRSYTLRQLRDGWVYVWVEEGGEQRLDEHRVEGATFGGQPHLTYSTQARLALAYSPVQWTERIQAYMLADAQVRQRVMRSVDLLAALSSTAQPGGAFPAHVGPLTQLAAHVADITPNGAVDGFTTTTVSTVAREEEVGDEDDNLYEVLSVKPDITQDSVLAKVERHDEALFVALDDDLGIVNDLTMALLGREAEREAFLDEHGQKLETALVTQALCGPDDSDLPEAIRNDPERYRQAQRLLQQRLEAQEGQEFSTAVNRGSPFGRAGSLLQRQHEERIAEIDSDLAAMGIEPPSRDERDAWRSKRRWRDDVDYAGVVNFINTEQPRLERLQAHAKASLEDVIVWLERLPTDGESLCFDLCDETQSQTLLEFAALVSQALGAIEQGRQWLTETFRERDSLIGTGPFNFSPALAAALDGIAQQWLEGGADRAGGFGVMPSDVAGFAGHVDTVLRLEHVQESALFLALAQPVQDTFATLQKVAAGAGRQVWEALTYQALPAAGAGAQVAAQQIAKGASIAMLAAFVHPDNQGSFLQRNDGALIQQRQWRAGMLRLSVQIKAQQLLLRTPMSPDRRAEVFRTLGALENDYQALALQEPKRFTAGTDPSLPGAQSRATQLATLGFGELREQHRLRMQRGAGGAAAARQRMARWMENQRIGGLPLLIAALNLVNVADSIRSAQRDGMSQADLEKIASQASYATAAIMALWVMPYWQRHANQMASLRGTTRKITGAGISKWQAAGQASVARIAAKLSSRVAGMAAFAAIGAGVEAWQIIQQYGRSTSNEERMALFAKGGATFGISAVGGVQLGGALLGRWFAFGWILAPWASWALLVLSAGYLMASLLAEHYRREGVRLWLYQSTWGKANKWSDSDADRAAELRALNEALLAPSLKLTPVVRTEFDVSRASSQFSPGRRVETLQGYWIQLALPAALGGEKVTIAQSAAGGFWAHSASFHQRPVTRQDIELPGASNYREEDPLRVWQVWLPPERLPDGQPFLLNVTYDEAVYGNGNGGLSFTFYKAEPRRGRYEVEVDDRYRGLCASATIELTVPSP